MNAIKSVQPSHNPTRKLSAATITGALMSIAGLIIRNIAPQWFDAGVWMALTPIVAFAIGWLIKDEATTVIMTEGQQ